MDESRHLRALQRIDDGLAEAERIGVLEGLNYAVEQGRMSIREAEECKEYYLRNRARDLGNLAVFPLKEEPPDAIA